MRSNNRKESAISHNQHLLREVCEQRDQVEGSLRCVIDACNAAIGANAFSKGKSRYKADIICAILKSINVLKQDHPERPHYDFTSLPKILKSKKYACSPQWFYKNLVGILLDIPIGKVMSASQCRRYINALQTMKYIGMETIGYGHTWSDDEILQEEVLCEFSKISGCCPDFTHPMPLHHIVYELNRFIQDYNPASPYAWYENQIHKEMQQALICACLVTAGINPTKTYDIYEYLSKPLPKKSLKIR